MAERLLWLGHNEATVAAAHLHDTVEDCAVTYAELVAEFGTEVAECARYVPVAALFAGNPAATFSTNELVDAVYPYPGGGSIATSRRSTAWRCRQLPSDVPFTHECVAKLSLDDGANRDSVGLRR